MSQALPAVEGVMDITILAINPAWKSAPYEIQFIFGSESWRRMLKPGVWPHHMGDVV